MAGGSPDVSALHDDPLKLTRGTNAHSKTELQACTTISKHAPAKCRRTSGSDGDYLLLVGVKLSTCVGPRGPVGRRGPTARSGWRSSNFGPMLRTADWKRLLCPGAVLHFAVISHMRNAGCQVSRSIQCNALPAVATAKNSFGRRTAADRTLRRLRPGPRENDKVNPKAYYTSSYFNGETVTDMLIMSAAKWCSGRSSAALSAT